MRDWTSSSFMQASGAYWESCAIHAAVHLDLFSPLKDCPLTEHELAARLGCDTRALNMLLTAMSGLGLVIRQGGKAGESGPCVLSPFAAKYLCRESPDYLGHMIKHQRDLVPAWARLDEAVRSGGPVRSRTSIETDDPAERESFLMGMYNIANAQAARSVPHIDLGGRSRLLDLGGATGIYAVHFCRANPGMTAVVFDLPTSQPFANRVLAEQTMTDRICFQGGDFIKDTLPTGFDVAWLSQILHGAGPREASLIVNKAAASLKAGGLLLIQEFILDNDRTGPLHPALFSLNMLVGTAEGQSFTEQELAEIMIRAGADDVRRLSLDLPQGCGIMAGTISTK